MITEDIGAVIEAMQDAGIDVHYIHGHRLEMSNRLDKMNKNPDKKYEKYPLIALNEMASVPERRGSITTWRLNIAILAKTKPEYYSPDRDENVFKPTLYPLYEQFLTYLKNSGLFFWPGAQSAPPHRPFERKYYGISSKEGNVKYIFNDPLDGIELIDLRVSQLKEC